MYKKNDFDQGNGSYFIRVILGPISSLIRIPKLSFTYYIPFRKFFFKYIGLLYINIKYLYIIEKIFYILFFIFLFFIFQIDYSKYKVHQIGNWCDDTHSCKCLGCIVNCPNSRFQICNICSTLCSISNVKEKSTQSKQNILNNINTYISCCNFFRAKFNFFKMNIEYVYYTRTGDFSPHKILITWTIAMKKNP